MATLTTTQTSPSLLGGVVIIGGTIIGAGMFSLPVGVIARTAAGVKMGGQDAYPVSGGGRKICQAVRPTIVDATGESGGDRPHTRSIAGPWSFPLLQLQGRLWL